MNDPGHPLADWREKRDRFVFWACIFGPASVAVAVGFWAWGGSLVCR
jgi:hypothetical protein